MKFSFINTLNSKARKGRINVPRISGMDMETPLLLLHTKGGSIPHISREVLELLSKDYLGIQITLPTTVQCYEGVKSFGKGISEFVGLKEMLTYCSIQDPAAITPKGYNSKNHISVWTHTGRVPLNVDRFFNIVEAFQPDFYQALSNGDTNENTSKKKTNKVLESTHRLLDKCLERHQTSLGLNSKAIFGVVEGGYDMDLRNLSAQFLATKPVNGFVISGFHNNGPLVEKINFKKVEPLLEAVLKHLPEGKPRIMHGCWRPEHIMKMVEMGIDIFDSSLVFVVTERKSALVFAYYEVPIDSGRNECSTCTDLLEVCLEDKRFREDFKPILNDCACLTCQKHSRAYVHHLIVNKELLASTLLMLHNLHHYMEFFKSIRRAISRGNRLCITQYNEDSES